jgi:hypothetical protein
MNMDTLCRATAGDASASCFSPFIEKTRNRTNELLKRGIREHEQSLAQDGRRPQSGSAQGAKKIAKSNERTIETRNPRA